MFHAYRYKMAHLCSPLKFDNFGAFRWTQLDENGKMVHFCCFTETMGHSANTSSPGEWNGPSQKIQINGPIWKWCAYPTLLYVSNFELGDMILNLVRPLIWLRSSDSWKLYFKVESGVFNLILVFPSKSYFQFQNCVSKLISTVKAISKATVLFFPT